MQRWNIVLNYPWNELDGEIRVCHHRRRHRQQHHHRRHGSKENSSRISNDFFDEIHRR